jgi:hypothetical protein
LEKRINRHQTGLVTIRLVKPAVTKMGFLDGVRVAGGDKRKEKFCATL